MQLVEKSPHLFAVCRRVFKPNDLDLIDSCFDLSLKNNGLEELDFEREEGVSFNPRPARISLILINNAKEKQAKTIAASIISCALDLNSNSKILENRAILEKIVPREIFELALAATKPFDFSFEENDFLSSAGRIAICAQLDRARHLHQSKKSADFCLTFVRNCISYANLAERLAPDVGVLLNAWINKFEPYYLEKVESANLS